MNLISFCIDEIPRVTSDSNKRDRGESGVYVSIVVLPFYVVGYIMLSIVLPCGKDSLKHIAIQIGQISNVASNSKH